MSSKEALVGCSGWPEDSGAAAVGLLGVEVNAAAVGEVGEVVVKADVAIADMAVGTGEALMESL